jgi:hypothetical protein
MTLGFLRNSYRMLILAVEKVHHFRYLPETFQLYLLQGCTTAD